MKPSKPTVPRLRFPEFKEIWKAQTVQQALEKRSVSVDVKPETEYYQIGLRSHGKGIFHKGAVSGESLGEKRVYWIQPNCLVLNIVFAWEQAVATTTENEKGMVASHRFPMYAGRNGVADVDFMLRFFLRKKGKHLLGLASPGGAGRNRTLGQSEFDKLKLTIPSLPEQRKIAEFLTAVDGRIGQLSQMKALLEDYKKGVMQQLFTQALRFKDDHGNDFPEWEVKTLGEVSEKVGSGKTPKGGEQVYQAFGVKFIRSQNVSGNRLDLSNVTFISEEINAEMKGTEVRPMDVLLNITGASIGRTCVVPEDFDRGNVNQHVCIIRPANDALSPLFLQLFLSSGFGQKLIEQGQSGSGREGLNFQSIRSFVVPLPSLPEQTKIANFLTALDRKIESVAQQIRHTQAFKKGLLQQMFV